MTDNFPLGMSCWRAIPFRIKSLFDGDTGLKRHLHPASGGSHGGRKRPDRFYDPTIRAIRFAPFEVCGFSTI